MVTLKIDPEFRDKIPPLTDAEFEQLQENILNDGEVYEPIAVWNGTIIDGHNRYKIILEHPEIPFRVKEMDFSDKWAAFEWMYKKQLGRRNLTDEQRTMLIGKMYEARKQTVAVFYGNQHTSTEVLHQNGGEAKKRYGTAAAIAEELGVGEGTVQRAVDFTKSVDAIREQSPEAAEKILQGGSGVTKGVMQEVHKMEPEKVKTLADAIIEGPAKTKEVIEKYKAPVTMESMNATPLPENEYTEDYFREDVMGIPKELDDLIRLFLLAHRDMLSNEYCKHAYLDMIMNIHAVADKYRQEVD